MADKLILEQGDIWTNNVGNNLIVVDPNKIVGPDGNPQDRLVNNEDLVMYANLEAKIFPRSKVVAGGKRGDKISVGIFDGELNFLKPKNSDSHNSDWTEAFTNPDINKKIFTKNEGIAVTNNVDFQGFGITSINVILNSSYIPQVTINFTDIRGKTLFEQARGNTPYTAFFHLPYPTFYLTLKGYYGKAIKYQLMMENFTSRFDPTSGDYLVTCIFKGNHIAMMRDINMHQVLTAPYMYPTKCDESGCITDTKGKQMLGEVYKIYKSKKLISEDFPESMTAVELIETLKSMDNDLSKLYTSAHLNMTTDKMEYKSLMTDLWANIFGSDGWKTKYLGKSVNVEVVHAFKDSEGSNKTKVQKTKAYELKGIVAPPALKSAKEILDHKEGVVKVAQDALDVMINKFLEDIGQNSTFGMGLYDDGENVYKVESELLNKYIGGVASLFEHSRANQGIRIAEKINLTTSNYPYIILEQDKASFGELYKELEEQFNTKATLMEGVVTKQLNNRLQETIGFKPTIRNVFAVLVSGADVFLRLMDEVHYNAMDVSDNEGRRKNVKDSNINSVFPWPEYNKVVEEPNICTTSTILKYPGAKDVIDETGADDKVVWPEVDFVEEYTKTSIYKSSEYKFESVNSGNKLNFTPISLKDWPPAEPYTVPQFPKIIWELLMRSMNVVRYGSVTTRVQGVNDSDILGLNEMAAYEAKNMYEKVKDFPGVVDLIKQLGTSLRFHLEIDKIFPDRTKNLLEYDFTDNYFEEDFDKYHLSDKIKFTTTETMKFADSEESINSPKDKDGAFDIIPTIFPKDSGSPVEEWVKTNYAGAIALGVSDFYDLKKSLTYDRGGTNVVIDSQNIHYFTDKKYVEGVECEVIHEERILLEKNLDVVANTLELYDAAKINKIITEGEINFNPITTSATSTEQPSKLTSVLNTPYFINALVRGTINEQILSSGATYTTAAYLFLNSLPLPTFREKALIKDKNVSFGAYISQLFNQVGAIHKIPTALALKIGSIWWRYKNTITNIDPLSDIWGDLGFIGGAGSTLDAYDSLSLSNGYTYNTGTTSYISQTGNTTYVGVYPNYINSLHYLVSGAQAPNIPPIGGDLDTIIDGNGLIAPLTIHHNSNIKITSGSGSGTTTVQFYDVFLDTTLKNSDNPLGAKLKDGSYNGRYFVLYPSSGALNDCDVDSYGPVVTGDTGTHNGACRLLWGASNYGYFKHNPSYMPPPNCYSKKVDNTKDKQTDWELNESNDYSTIEELQGVFTKDSLDMFEELFLEFSSNKGSIQSGGTLKGLIREIMVIENTYVSQTEDPNDITHLTKELRNAQMKKFQSVMDEFIGYRTHYIHKSTTNLEQGKTPETTLINLIKSTKSDILIEFSALGVFSNTQHDFTTTPTLPPGNIIRSTMVLCVGEYSTVNSGYTIANFTQHDLTNPMYGMFKDIRKNGRGIEMSPKNIEILAPFIRLYVSHLIKTNTSHSPTEIQGYVDIFIGEIKKLEERESKFIDTVLKKFGKSFKEEGTNGNDEDMFDSRTSLESDDLKLELYHQFKLMNDRWVSGMELANQTIFERFLFFDRANRNIGDVAYVDIWDIIALDTPFDKDNGKTLTQSLYSFLSTIVANNKWNMLALPAYVNFHSMKGDSQAQGNSVFGAFKDVNYIDSAPVFLCQYIGKPSENLDKRDVNNGYKDDSSDLNKVVNNILIGGDCGNEEEKNKVVGFNVDFGVPNQNIFESITLDQSQYQNTSESYKILQQMADSGGPGSTSMASSSLFNVYASRSYTCKVTCMGNMMIQPTQYFQLRYLPMFNGPYLITSVSHTISPNNIETSFEGIRVPIPKMPTINDLVQRVNDKIFDISEKKVKAKKDNTMFDGRKATAKQLELKEGSNGFIDILGQIPVDDDIALKNPLDPNSVDIVAHNKEHLGIDFRPKTEQYTDNGVEIFVYPIFKGIVEDFYFNCDHTSFGDKGICSSIGNYFIIRKTIMETPKYEKDTTNTVYYRALYYNLSSRGTIDDIAITQLNRRGSVVYGFEVGPTGVPIATMGNTGDSTGWHLHLEIRRGVILESGEVVEHIMNPHNSMLPMTS